MTAINEKLSPVAEAIEDAAYAAWVIKDDSRSIAISTLRALADQAGSMKHWHVDQLRTIAAELEGAERPPATATALVHRISAGGHGDCTNN